MKPFIYPAAMSLLFCVACTYSQAEEQTQDGSNTFSNEWLDVGFSNSGVNRINFPGDPHDANLIDGTLGSIDVVYQYGEGDWLNVATGGRDREIDTNEQRATFVDFRDDRPIRMEQNFTLDGNKLIWDIEVWNQTPYPVTLGDFSVDIASRSSSGGNKQYNFEESFTRRHFVSADGSFMVFSKRGGAPPYALLAVQPGTSLEYYEGSDYFIHSGLTGNNQTEGTWRQPHTYLELGPEGEGNDRVTYGFTLHRADTYDELRDLLVENDLIDVRVVPGMTVPEDLEAKFSLHTRTTIDDVVAEFPDDTEITYLGESQPDHHLYSVKFNRLGENMITVHFDGDRKTNLEFFATEPIATLIEKRTRFMVENQQHRNPDVWYDGLFSVWDMKNQVLRGPDNPDVYEHWWGYVLAADDPALGHAPYLASVNAIDPEPEQIEAIEYYLENYVWGGLQRTDEQDPYPYGVYGTPNWKTASDPLGRLGIETQNHNSMKVWRSYDYPHIMMLYYHMYQIAERYPDMVNYLDADGYLERLWGTAQAFFNYPYNILTYYETYQWGLYNELLVPEMVELLEEKGRQEDADWLRREWEKKVLYFVYEDPYPYRSEYATDRTAFESTYALARYGATVDIPPGDSLWFNKVEESWYSYDEGDIHREDAREFMEQQHYAGLAVRGWLEPKYFQLGADGSMSYMARMHGWSILNYGLEFADDPHDWLQLGYASYLSSFSLVNTGRPETDYGFWFPGEENDGALGWAFQRSKHGGVWARQQEDRGSWRYDGEGNLGMGAVTRTATTILTEDPIFGWTAYGANMEQTSDGFDIYPRDGVLIRFWLVDGENRLGVELERDGWSEEDPIRVSDDLGNLEFQIENRTGTTHTNRLELQIHNGEQWQVSLDGNVIEPFRQDDFYQFERNVYELPISAGENRLELVKN
ncbi:MAG: DUF5695 domain-containing protein [Balneolaceae bacterium]